MKKDKYSNLNEILPSLSSVLKEAIQAETLEIKAVDKMCSRFLTASQKHPELSKAEFVIYSPYVRKADHAFEHFVFVDRIGKSICHISGSEMELYGLLVPCTNLRVSKTFEHEQSEEES